jgi:hypothetical protein
MAGTWIEIDAGRWVNMARMTTVAPGNRLDEPGVLHLYEGGGSDYWKVGGERAERVLAYLRGQQVPGAPDEIGSLRAEVARLEAKSKALRAKCSDLWEVIERAKDALPRYDGLYVADVAETLEILQGALDEEPEEE